MTEAMDTPARRLVLVTGPAGAGRSTAIHALEDLGYEAIDNIPLRLIRPLLDDPATDRPVALGIDPRNRHFAITTVSDILGQVAEMPNLATDLLYLDCSTEVLLRRFSETRRRHPMAATDQVEAGIQREIALLAPLRERADVLIDTTNLNVHQLREEMEEWFAPVDATTLAISVQSFSYKRGLPRSVDMVFDCRFLKNPYWEPSLRKKNGLDSDVLDHIRTDPRCATFEQKLLDMTLWLLPAYKDEGKSHLSVALGCTGGQHRSVALAETLSAALAEHGWQVSTRHRELDRHRREEASA